MRHRDTSDAVRMLELDVASLMGHLVPAGRLQFLDDIPALMSVYVYTFESKYSRIIGWGDVAEKAQVLKRAAKRERDVAATGLLPFPPTSGSAAGSLQPSIYPSRLSVVSVAEQARSQAGLGRRVSAHPNSVSHRYDGQASQHGQP
jgi:hypothetical protein